MRSLSDYQGEEALELWADLLEPITQIIGDPEIAKVLQSKKPPLLKASAILKKYKAEAEKILLRIDPEPLDGLNVLVRLAAIIVDVGQNEEIKTFFGFAEQEKTDNASSGSATENTKAEEK